MTLPTYDTLDAEAYAAGRAGALIAEKYIVDGLQLSEPVALICVTCGVQYAPTLSPPALCPTCADDRQYIGWHGQQWTTLDQLAQSGHRNRFSPEEPNLESVETDPAVAIGQHVLLVRTPEGNYLWDCLSYVDDATVEEIRVRGGLRGIAISHPHFYGTMRSWAEAFDVPVFVHEADREFVRDDGAYINYWSGKSLQLNDELTLINTGGHFPGSCVMHWRSGADGRGTLFSGDTIKPVMDRAYVSFMYSIVNLIPLSASRVESIVDALDPYEFDRIYSLWRYHAVDHNAKQAVKRSADRYIAHLRGDLG